jgi:hypothetical protein
MPLPFTLFEFIIACILVERYPWLEAGPPGAPRRDAPWSPAWHHRVERDAARAAADGGRPGTDREIVGGHRENAGYFGPRVPAVRIDPGARAMLSTEQLYTKMHAFTGNRYLLHAFL